MFAYLYESKNAFRNFSLQVIDEDEDEDDESVNEWDTEVSDNGTARRRSVRSERVIRLESFWLIRRRRHSTTLSSMRV